MLYSTYRPQTFKEVVGQENNIRSASNAAAERLCTSSMIYIFFGNMVGIYWADTISSFMSVIELCDAADRKTG